MTKLEILLQAIDQTKEAILQIQRDYQLNTEGAQYVQKNFSSRYMIRELVKAYNRVASDKYSKASLETEEN